MTVAELVRGRIAEETQAALDLELVGTMTIKNSSTFSDALRLDILVDGESAPRSSLEFYDGKIEPGNDFLKRADQLLLESGYYLVNAKYIPRGIFGVYPEQVRGDLYREC